MGILKEPAVFVEQLKLPAGFSVCELGDQWISYTNPPSSAAQFYRSLGCGRYVAIDGNGRGDILADLNLPLTAFTLGTFDLVTDFWTGEHIFDQAQVWRTLHALAKPGGGYIVVDRPAQGYDGHCFYRADECLYRDVAAANQYTIVRLEKKTTPRGVLIRGMFHRTGLDRPFRIPQQGRYQRTLRVAKGAA